FRVQSTVPEPHLPVLLPAAYRSLPIGSVTVDGLAYAPGALRAKGLDYATVALASGTHSVVVTYRAGATVTPTSASPPTPTGTASATATPTSSPTPTAVPAAGGQTDTTVADFGRCPPAAGLIVAD